MGAVGQWVRSATDKMVEPQQRMEKARMDLRSRRVLITGGTRGIGRALVEEMHRVGSVVITCGRDPVRVEALARELPGVDVFVADLAREQAIEQLRSHIETRHGSLDVLINNAAMQLPLQLDAGADATEIQEEMTVNLLAPMRLTGACLPLLARSASAAIVNVTSVLGAVPRHRAPFYSVEKAGLRAFTRLLRDQLDGTAIHVMEAMPGLMDTDMAAHVEGPPKAPPAAFARKVRKGLERERRVVILGPNRWIVRIDRYAPGLARRWVA